MELNPPTGLADPGVQHRWQGSHNATPAHQMSYCCQGYTPMQVDSESVRESRPTALTAHLLIQWVIDCSTLTTSSQSGAVDPMEKEINGGVWYTTRTCVPGVILLGSPPQTTGSQLSCGLTATAIKTSQYPRGMFLWSTVVAHGRVAVVPHNVCTSQELV